MLTSMPHVEDGAPGRKTAPGIGRPPPGEDGIDHPVDIDEIENAAQDAATDGAEQDDDDEDFDGANEKPTDKDFLKMVGAAAKAGIVLLQPGEPARVGARLHGVPPAAFHRLEIHDAGLPQSFQAVHSENAQRRPQGSGRNPASLFGSHGRHRVRARQRIRSAPARVCRGHQGTGELPHEPTAPTARRRFRGFRSRWARGRPRS
jgi:hypothetical protein